MADICVNCGKDIKRDSGYMGWCMECAIKQERKDGII